MSTSTQTAAKKTTAKPVPKTAAKKPAAKKPAAKPATKAATKKPVASVAKPKTPASTKKTLPVKKVAKTAKATKSVREAKPEVVVHPVKEVFNRTSMLNHHAEKLMNAEIKGLELNERQAKSIVKHLLQEQEALMLGSVHPKGSGEFTIPGLMKIFTKKMPARKPREMKSPLTGEMIMTKAKPASVRVKARILRKMKQAAL